MQDLIELIDIVTAFEKGSAPKQLCKYAANGPDIDYVYQRGESSSVRGYCSLALV